jgi:HEAT repeat protein
MTAHRVMLSSESFPSGGRVNVLEFHRTLHFVRSSAVRMLTCLSLLVFGMGGFGQANKVSDLIVKLMDPDAYVRQRAAVGLGFAHDPLAVEPLITALKDTDAGVRQAAVSALADFKDPRAVEPLITALNDPGPFVRMQASYALGESDDPRAVKPLVRALKDKDANVRLSATQALRRVGVPAIPDLINAMKDPLAEVRNGAKRALVDIGTPSIVPLKGALSSSDSSLRQSAIAALAEIRSPRTSDSAAKPRARSVAATANHPSLGAEANDQQFNSTDLPFEALEMTVSKGGGVQEAVASDGVIRSTCSGISLKSLRLGEKDIFLMSTGVTSDCKIETRDYGKLLIKINTATFSYSILVTPRQEKLFRSQVH